MEGYVRVGTPLPRVVIAGATGHLGQYITNAFLSPSFRPLFSDITLLTRQASNSNSQLSEWIAKGAGVRVYGDGGDSIHAILAEADVLVNAIGSAGYELRDEIVRAIPGTKVRMYFPSEFGVDHTVHDFEHVEWDKKKRHYDLAMKTLGGRVAIVRVFCGLFLEDSVGPWFGFDTKGGRYEAVGGGDRKASYTSLEDVGKVVAQLACMDVKEVPGELRIGGDSVSVRDIAKIMGKVSGQEIEVEDVEYTSFKEKALKSERKDPAECLRFLMGDGNLLHTEEGIGCDNELVNPGQSYWDWKTMRDLAVETKGKPWADMEWSPES